VPAPAFTLLRERQVCLRALTSRRTTPDHCEATYARGRRQRAATGRHLRLVL